VIDVGSVANQVLAIVLAFLSGGAGGLAFELMRGGRGQLEKRRDLRHAIDIG